VIRSAIDRGVNLFDHRGGFGPYVNEELVGAFFNELAAKRTDHVERLFLSVVRVSMRAPKATKSVCTKKVHPN